MIEFEKPKIHKIEEGQDYGKFVVEPLERGYGTTLGNSLLRILAPRNERSLMFKLMVCYMNSPL